MTHASGWPSASDRSSARPRPTPGFLPRPGAVAADQPAALDRDPTQVVVAVAGLIAGQDRGGTWPTTAAVATLSPKPVGPGGSSLIETGDGHADANRGGGGPRHQHSSVSPGPTGGAPATSGRAGGRARPRGALRETPPIPPLAPPADPVAVASELLSRAKSEIERLEDEKRSAEKELARVKAKIEAANAGIAKWRRLARAMSNALGESKGTDDPPPTAEAVVPAPSLPAEEPKPVERATTAPADTPLVPRPTGNEPPPGAPGAMSTWSSSARVTPARACRPHHALSYERSRDVVSQTPDRPAPRPGRGPTSSSRASGSRSSTGSSRGRHARRDK